MTVTGNSEVRGGFTIGSTSKVNTKNYTFPSNKGRNGQILSVSPTNSNQLEWTNPSQGKWTHLGMTYQITMQVMFTFLQVQHLIYYYTTVVVTIVTRYWDG